MLLLYLSADSLTISYSRGGNEVEFPSQGMGLHDEERAGEFPC